uniref:Alpha-endosulfine n=9 Tax=Colubroidea TaxID=34989 RepID=A0A8C6X3W1_NAJNA
MSDTRGGSDSRPDETGVEKQDTQEKETGIPEKEEEAKLKAKYPNIGLQKPGGSDFLMKRLQKGQKYFDSGDYNMAKAKIKNKQLPTAGTDKNLVTGDHIPTPQDLPQRKSSLVTSKLAGCLLRLGCLPGLRHQLAVPLLVEGQRSEGTFVGRGGGRTVWPEVFQGEKKAAGFRLIGLPSSPPPLRQS